VVLTGMGADGAIGVRTVRQAGGRTIAESQESSIVYGMPKEAIQTGCIDEVLALGQIIERVAKFALPPTP
jgi:two-component system chemotaxis response regulator CheB